MPEGDTVFKVGAVIRQDLHGHQASLLYLRGLTRAELRTFQGLVVTGVRTLGKHLLLDFESRWVVRVHLGMYGSWNRFPRDRKVRPRADTGLIVSGPATLLVCERPRDVELIAPGEERRHPVLTALGPDLLAAEVDWPQLLSRAARLCPAQTPLADLLVNQKVACGLGNVYRNELCFLGTPRGESGPFRPGQGHDPYRPWGELSSEALLGIYGRGRQLLQANLGGWPRTTTFDARRALAPGAERLWVYGRTGKNCWCGAVLLGSHQGDYARATHWCPRCQAGGSLKG